MREAQINVPKETVISYHLYFFVSDTINIERRDTMSVSIKRIYEDASDQDGFRVLVDRVWPRGISKEKAKLDEWLKEIGPSTELRKWFNHEDDKFDEFEKKYQKELQSGKQKEALKKLQSFIKDHKHITLLYGAKNETHNQAVVLNNILK